MIPEFANAMLAIALALSVVLSIVPLIGVARQNIALMSTARPLVYMQFVAMLLAFVGLMYLLAVNDFSVSYVALNSNRELPIYFRIAASWAAHEGSLLLWVFLLSCWTFAVAWFSRQMPIDAIARVLAVMGMISIGFLAFVIFTSNPFSRTLPDFPINGRDLNPLLQDIGLIFHPPLLYMGYVGFSVAFAFSIASLLAGRLDTAWARWSRPWTVAAWIFLTLGIALGSFWAYYVLGWGGWWFWDPVENASLMPWLTGTALMHSLAVTEKRSVFKAWTVLLAITSFSLCLLGTFLVRSGILVSVHAFAADPTRGMFILAYLLLVVGGSLLLYAVRGAQINRSRSQYEFISRESFLLGNNILLMTAMLVVLLGTLLPLVHRLLGLGSISVGVPFFNLMFTWLSIPFAVLLGVAPLIRWRRDALPRLFKQLMIALIICVAAAVILPIVLEDKLLAITFVGLMIASWVIILILMELYQRATYRHSLWQGLRRISSSHWGMSLAHFGVAVTIIGIVFSQNYSIERDVRMAINGDPVMIRDYQFRFISMGTSQGANYVSDVATIEVSRGTKFLRRLLAEKRYYNSTGTMMTEVAIDGGITRDLYVALGEKLDDNSWAVRLYYKPFVRWIWFGSLFMVLGGLLCLLDKRYRMKKLTDKEQA